MKDYLNPDARPLLERHQLDSFEALWQRDEVPVDQPNTGRGGWSSVVRLELNGQGFYLKRQINYCTRSLLRPLGEPTFARELRTILLYRKRGIPALKAACFFQRKINGQQHAVLLTYALDGWQDLEYWLGQWPQLSDVQRQALILACAELTRALHERGEVHGCLYPKHVFLQPGTRGFRARLIDLEKTRWIMFDVRDRIKDLDTLVRRAWDVWNDQEIRAFLAHYLAQPSQVESWFERLALRRAEKLSRE